MSVFDRIETFLLHFCPSSSPILLALSGGADSLCLFYALLLFREKYGTPFHVAHVDHRWREESQKEAHALHQLAVQHHVPFHMKVLDPTLLKGNLEAACREERYAFFAEICQQISFQGVLTGHHQDDQAETIFKRVLEGAHWSRWGGLQLENWIKGIRILRPLLEITKKEIQETLSQKNIHPFEDPSNRHLQFLRARLRETIFPRLNQEFGKEVQQSLIAMGKDAQELVDYFDARLVHLLEHLIQGPWGVYLDLETFMPMSLLEMKYLLRLLCKQKGFFLSRDILEQAARALELGKANQLFAMGSHQIRIDRQQIFILDSSIVTNKGQALKISSGSERLGQWKLNVSEEVYFSHHQSTSWKEGWKGQLRSYLPMGNYTAEFKQSLDGEVMNGGVIKKRWNQAKVPAFLYSYFPLILDEKQVCHEFLTGQPLFALNEGNRCWKIELTYVLQEGFSNS